MNVRSKITAQNQVSVPADVRKDLGIGPGSSIEWVKEDGKVVVKRVGKFTIEDVHKAAFPNGPPPYVADPRGEGVRAYMRKKHARD